MRSLSPPRRLVPGLVAVSLMLGMPVHAQPSGGPSSRKAAESGAEEEPAPEAAEPISLEPAQDAAVARRLREILARIEGLEEVTVEVHSGVVRLAGRTPSLAAKEEAAGIARRLEGVLYVDNDIEQATDLASRLKPTWAKLRDYARRAVDFLPTLIVALVVFLFFVLLSRLVRRWRRPFGRLGVSELTSNLIRMSLEATVVLIGMVLALDILGVVAVVGAVVGTVGVLTLVLGLAFKDLVSNDLPGVLLSIGRPFDRGDLVLVAGHEGKVVRVTSRDTVLMTLDGEHVRIPNARVFQETLVNYTRNRERRLKFDVELALGVDLRRAREIGREALLEVRGVIPEPPPFMRTMEVLGDRVQVRFFAWADQQAANFRNVESRAKRAVVEALVEAQVPFAVDHLVLSQLEAAPSRPRVPEAPEEPLEEELPENASEPFIDARIQEEWARSEERDLLKQGRRPPRREP